MTSTVVIGQIGVGNWGRNILRNVAALEDVSVRWVCDLESGAGLHGRRLVGPLAHPQPGPPAVTVDYLEILRDPAVDAVIVATRPDTHFEITRASLRAGKHVFVEKPMAMRSEEAVELIDVSERKRRLLMVGHLLRYHPAYVRLKEMIDAGELGRVYYGYSTRVNLGIVRSEENSLWSLAPHDISVFLDLMDTSPTWVSATGQSFLQEGVEDVTFTTIHFEGSQIARVHVSWLDPHKIRRMTVVGAKKMVVVDDMEGSEKMRIYDKGVELSADYVPYGEALTLRMGDIQIPYIKVEEPLRLEVQHFVDCVRSGRKPRTDGGEGLRVLQILEAAQRSLRQNGAPVEVRHAF
jgi:predicted dehydrogenase